MIPVPGYVAVFKHPDGQEYTRPVLAWGDQGEPLVVDPKRGLIPVNAEWGTSGFVRLQTANPPATVIPGGGWIVTYTDPAGTEQTTPVVAWRIHSTGSVAGGYGHPLIAIDDLGFLSDPSEFDEPFRVWHPARTTGGSPGQGPAEREPHA